MDYKKIYDQICDRARSRKLTTYKEKHHVVPRCLGGDNSKDNIVELTAKEHFLCHLLLCKIFPDHDGLLYALNMMCTINKKQTRYIPSAKTYEYIRYKLSVSKSFSQIGPKNHMWNRKGADHYRSKKVVQYDKNDNYIKTWDCIREVSRVLKIHPSNISHVCSGRIKTTGGFKWRYF